MDRPPMQICPAPSIFQSDKAASQSAPPKIFLRHDRFLSKLFSHIAWLKKLGSKKPGQITAMTSSFPSHSVMSLGQISQIRSRRPQQRRFRTGQRPSVRLNAGGFHEHRIRADLVPDVGVKFAGAHRHRLGAEQFQSFLDRRQFQGLQGLLMQPLNDVA